MVAWASLVGMVLALLLFFLQGRKKVNVALYCSIFVSECTFTHIPKSLLFRLANLAFICFISVALFSRFLAYCGFETKT